MVTILDVAHAAGVSVATVSRVLNNENCVRPETAQNVRETMARLQYVPNITARNLRRNESKTILVTAESFTNPFYGPVLSGIGKVAAEKGYNVIVSVNNQDFDAGHRHVRLLEAGQADGAILLSCTENDKWLSSYVGRYPILQACEIVDEFPTLKIRMDHYKIGYEGTHHLAALGHQRIAYIGATNLHSSTYERYAGYRAAMDELGLPHGEELYAETDWDYSPKKNCECARKLLTLAERPTAIVCVADMVAYGVLSVAEELEISVPEQLSVVGCDDIMYSTMRHPFLTTFHIPSFSLGEECASMLLRRIQGECGDNEEMFMEVPLIVRESTSKVIS